MRDKANDIEERLVEFAVRIIGVVEALPDTKSGNHIAGQLVRSGTSPAPNYGEAQSAESRNDFIHKMKVCLKELRETQIWLKIIGRKPLCSPDRLTPIIQENDELISIFVKSVKTAQDNKEPYSRRNPAKPL
jgi:four helix bundle protein